MPKGNGDLGPQILGNDQGIHVSEELNAERQWRLGECPDTIDNVIGVSEELNAERQWRRRHCHFSVKRPRSVSEELNAERQWRLQRDLLPAGVVCGQ